MVIEMVIMRSRFANGTVLLTNPLAVPLVNRVGDAFGKRRPVGRCGGGNITAGTTGCGWVG